MGSTSWKRKGLYMLNQVMFPVWTWWDAEEFSVCFSKCKCMCFCPCESVSVGDNCVLTCIPRFSYLAALLLWEAIMGPLSPLAPCLTLSWDPCLHWLLAWPWIMRKSQLVGESERFSHWRRTLRFRQVPLRWISHSSSLKAHILSVLCSYPLWTQISQPEGKSV